METERHRHQMNLLIESLALAWKARDDFYVGGNMFVYFSETQARRNDFRGPDVFVVLNTVKKERKSWVVWEEEGRTPDVVIELTSESTRAVDRGEKMRIYSQIMHVADYYIFDPLTAELEGYEIDPRTGLYKPLAFDERGRLPVPRLGLTLDIVEGVFTSVEARWLRWVDMMGELLPHPLELAESEARRAWDLAEKLKQYEVRFGKLPDE
jgi:Uma2 family endonuclease